MMYLRTSSLEAFRRIYQTPYGNEQALIETIKRGQWTEGPSSWQMQAGTAWHTALETAGTFEAGTYVWVNVPGTQDRYHFEVMDVIAARQHRGPGTTEVNASREFKTNAGPVLLSGKADLIQGLYIRDAKTCFSVPAAKHYERSLQWRAYLLLHEAKKFTYDLFDFAKPKFGFCKLKDIWSVDFWTYPGIEEDVGFWVNSFAEWSERKQLHNFLLQRR